MPVCVATNRIEYEPGPVAALAWTTQGRRPPLVSWKLAASVPASVTVPVKVGLDGDIVTLTLPTVWGLTPSGRKLAMLVKVALAMVW